MEVSSRRYSFSGSNGDKDEGKAMVSPYYGGYGGYGGYGYGYGYPPYMNGGYGVGAAPVQTGPLNSTPITPYENVKGELNHVEHSNGGMVKGGVFGALGGALVLGSMMAIGGGPIGFAIGALLGGAGGGILGGFLGKKFGGYESMEHDAKDDGKLNGSSLGSRYDGYGPVYY